MRTVINLSILLLLILFSSCVQKTYKKTVVFTVDISEIKNIKTVGIRGNNKPLSWDFDTKMKEIKKDSLFQITITGETGYKFTEVKFVVNDTFEFQNEANRRIVFSEKDSTFYNAKFNKR